MHFRLGIALVMAKKWNLGGAELQVYIRGTRELDFQPIMIFPVLNWSNSERSRLTSHRLHNLLMFVGRGSKRLVLCDVEEGAFVA